MDSENRMGKALSFSVDGRDVKNQNKRNYNRRRKVTRLNVKIGKCVLTSY